jgi:hypothetical protein
LTALDCREYLRARSSAEKGKEMPDKGFTFSILPHGGKPPRQYEFRGTKLALLRAAVLVFVLLLAGALAIVTIGAGSATSVSGLRQRIEVLEDSLASVRGIEARLDSVERTLERVQEFRVRIESLATAGNPAPGDSL